MASSRPGLSPYNYCQNNPLVRIDPDGMRDIANSANGDDEKDDEKKKLYVGIETEGTGHAFIAISNNEGEFTTYSYGRWDGGKFYRAPFGDGVLLKKKGESASNYINYELNKEGGSLILIDNINVAKVESYYEALLSNSNKPSKRFPKEGKIVDEYLLLGNSCVTSTCNGIIAGGRKDLVTKKTLNPAGPSIYNSLPITPDELKNMLMTK